MLQLFKFYMYMQTKKMVTKVAFWGLTTARRHLLYQSNHKTQVIWKGRGGLLCYSPTSPSCVRAAAVDAACSCSGTAVPTGPADASEGEICVAENYVARGIEPKTSVLIPC
jgi:hypothetical protein